VGRSRLRVTTSGQVAFDYGAEGERDTWTLI
jgi:hypothetical protein